MSDQRSEVATELLSPQEDFLLLDTDTFRRRRFSLRDVTLLARDAKSVVEM